jgi:cell division protein FtsW (lipid II flippase)
MPDWWHVPIRSPYLFLILGIISFSLAVVWTCIGKARTRFHGWVYRAEEPNQFWFQVALYYLVGVGFIGYFLYLYKAHGLSS